MLRRSTPGGDLSAQIESFGGEVNAITSKEDIFFYCRVPPANALDAIGMLAEWLARTALPLAELENEKRIITEELRSEASDPAEAIYDVLHAKLFPSGGLGQPPGGTVDGVDSLTAEVVADCHEERIHPQTLGLVVVGAVDPADVVDRLLGSPVAELPTGEWRPEDARDARPSRSATPNATVVAIPSDYVSVGFAVEAFSYQHEDCTAAEVLAVLLGGPPSSLLFRVMRSERGLAYSVGAWHRGFTDTGVLRVEIGTSPQNAFVVHGDLQPLMADAIDRGWSSDEVERAKLWHIGQLRFEAERSFDEAFMLSRHRLIGGIGEWTLSDHLARIGEVEPAHVSSIGRHLLQRESVSAVVGGVGN